MESVTPILPICSRKTAALSVIGAGFGRTGTLSLKLALEQLGFGPCYHMIETRKTPEHDVLWLDVAQGDRGGWRQILAGYASCVDWPAIMVWKELIAANPDAKVILTVRDPESWYESASRTIFPRMLEFANALARGAEESLDPAHRAHMEMIKAVVVEGSFGGNIDKAHATSVFKAHNEEVSRSVPQDRLLVYESGEGWDKLCTFLGAPVPQAPYPKVNSTEDFNARFPTRTAPQRT